MTKKNEMNIIPLFASPLMQIQLDLDTDKLKYGNLLPNTTAELEEIRDTLNEMLADRGLTYPS